MTEEYKPLTYKEFCDSIKTIQEEVGRLDEDGRQSGTRHYTYVETWCVDDTQDDFDIVGVEPVTNPGCGCWTGVRILLKKSTR